MWSRSSWTTAALEGVLQRVFDLTPDTEEESRLIFRLDNLFLRLLTRSAAEKEMLGDVPVADSDSGTSFKLSMFVDDADAVCAELVERGVAIASVPSIDRGVSATPPSETQTDTSGDSALTSPPTKAQFSGCIAELGAGKVCLDTRARRVLSVDFGGRGRRCPSRARDPARRGCFLKIDGDQTRTDVEVEAMALAPIPIPEVLWRSRPCSRSPPSGTTLGRLGKPLTASAAAWAAAGAAVRMLHDAPSPLWPGRSLAEVASRLEDECHCGRLALHPVWTMELPREHANLCAHEARRRKR